MRRFIVALAVTASALLGTAPATGQPTAAGDRPSGPCEQLYSQSEHARYARAVLNHRSRVTRAASRRLERMRRCQHTPEASRNALRLTRKLRKARPARLWQIRFESLAESDQAWALNTAKCESGAGVSRTYAQAAALNTGNGFFGAVQWVISTWHMAGGSGHPTQASFYEHLVRAVWWRNKTSDEQWPVCGD